MFEWLCWKNRLIKAFWLIISSYNNPSRSRTIRKAHELPLLWNLGCCHWYVLQRLLYVWNSHNSASLHLTGTTYCSCHHICSSDSVVKPLPVELPVPNKNPFFRLNRSSEEWSPQSWFVWYVLTEPIRRSVFWDRRLYWIVQWQQGLLTAAAPLLFNSAIL